MKRWWKLWWYNPEWQATAFRYKWMRDYWFGFLHWWKK